MRHRQTLLVLILIILPVVNVVALPLDLDCLVKPEVYIELSSPVDNTVVESLLVEAGDTITSGQALVQLEASVERARVALAQQRASQLSDIRNRQTQLEYIILNNKRLKDLFAKKSTSQFELDKSNTELSIAKIELSKAREAKRVAELNLQLAEAQLALKTIRSPIDGIVLDIFAEMGESVSDRTIMTIAQINPLRVELIAPTEYFGLIKPGMEALITSEHSGDATYKATVMVVDQLIDLASGSFTVRMALPNPDDQIVGGINCLARFR